MASVTRIIHQWHRKISHPYDGENTSNQLSGDSDHNYGETDHDDNNVGGYVHSLELS
jgi:hypothetical protein